MGEIYFDKKQEAVDIDNSPHVLLVFKLLLLIRMICCEFSNLSVIF